MAKIRNLTGALQIEIGSQHGVTDDGSEYEVADGKGFTSQAQMVKHMRQPEYKTSKSYRDMVQKMIRNSDPVAIGMADAPDNGEAEFEQAKMASVRELFSDPRYSRDARYRAEVKEIVAKYGDTYFPEYARPNVEAKAATHRLEFPITETGMIDPKSQQGDGE